MFKLIQSKSIVVLGILAYLLLGQLEVQGQNRLVPSPEKANRLVKPILGQESPGKNQAARPLAPSLNELRAEVLRLQLLRQQIEQQLLQQQLLNRRGIPLTLAPNSIQNSVQNRLKTSVGQSLQKNAPSIPLDSGSRSTDKTSLTKQASAENKSPPLKAGKPVRITNPFFKK